MKKLLFLALCLMNIASAQSIEFVPSGSVTSSASSSARVANPTLFAQAGTLSVSGAQPVPIPSNSTAPASRPNFVPADGGVILYGQVDQGWGYTRQSTTGEHQGVPFSIKQSNSGMRSGAKGDSKVGIRAEQSIGGGNKVFIQIEEQFDGATGTPLKERGTTVIGIGG